MTTPNQDKPGRKVNTAILSGKITSVRRHDDFTYTEITLPAQDEYSSPATVEIRSKKRIGQGNDSVQVEVQCGGYRGRAFNYTDKQTGEQFSRRPVVNSYTAIED